MSQHFSDTIRQLFARAYEDDAPDQDYQSGFAEEGFVKSQYIIDDLRFREAARLIRTREMGYLSIGGADASEIARVLTDTAVPKGVVIEVDPGAISLARARAERLSSLGKELVIIQGDATVHLDSALRILEAWCGASQISGLICSAQAVLHELPTRSPGFDLALLLGTLYRHTEWRTCLFYSREPAVPQGWPDAVRIRIPGLPGADLVRFARYVRDRLNMSGTPKRLAADWVDLPAPLAVETLHKLIRGTSLRRIGYELGEQLTSLDPMAVKRNLEAFVPGMRVTVDYITTAGFKAALRHHEVEYVGHEGESLAIPHTHAEIIGFWSAAPAGDNVPPAVEEAPTKPPALRPTIDCTWSNPFDGDVSDGEIALWLSQFDPHERPIMAKLVSRFRYISLRQLRRLLVQLHAQVEAQLGAAAANTWFVPFGGVAKSGGMVAYFYRVENSIPVTQFTDYAGLVSRKGDPIVFLDDLVASGHQAAEQWRGLRTTIEVSPETPVLLATVVACEQGRHFLFEHTDLEVVSAIQIARTDDAVDATSNCFLAVEDWENAQRTLLKYGERLAPKHPLGYAGRGLLVGFAHSVPDNCPPVFWSTQAGWRPLLRAGGSPRLANDVGLPSSPQ